MAPKTCFAKLAHAFLSLKLVVFVHLPALLDLARTIPALANPVPTLDRCQKGAATDLNTDERQPQTHGPKGSFSLRSPVACTTGYATSLNI